MDENAKRHSLTHCIDFAGSYDYHVDSLISEHFNRKYLFDEREIQNTKTCPMLLLIIRIQHGMREPLEFQLDFEDFYNVILDPFNKISNPNACVSVLFLLSMLRGTCPISCI